MNEENSNTELIKKLLKIQKEQEMILDSIPAWIFYKDAENRFIRVNNSFAKIMKLSKEELEGKSMFDFYPKEQAEAYWKDDKEVISSGIAKINIVEKMNSPEGILWVKTDKIPHKDENGNTIGVIGFSIDITFQKKAEEEAKMKNQELEKFNRLMIGRELEMIKLKKEIIDLKNLYNDKK